MGDIEVGLCVRKEREFRGTSVSAVTISVGKPLCSLEVDTGDCRSSDVVKKRPLSEVHEHASDTRVCDSIDILLPVTIEIHPDKCD